MTDPHGGVPRYLLFRWRKPTVRRRWADPNSAQSLRQLARAPSNAVGGALDLQSRHHRLEDVFGELMDTDPGYLGRFHWHVLDVLTGLYCYPDGPFAWGTLHE